jgi:hypothetical protein
MLVKLEDGNLKDVPILEVNKDNYIVPEGEEDTYHCKIELVRFSPSSGRRLSRPKIQKFNAKIYHQIMREHLKQQGYSVEVLYDPTEWLKEQEAEVQRRKQAMKIAKEQSKLQAEAKRKKEIDEAVAKALAEYMATEKQKQKPKGKADVNTRNLKG